MRFIVSSGLTLAFTCRRAARGVNHSAPLGCRVQGVVRCHHSFQRESVIYAMIEYTPTPIGKLAKNARMFNGVPS